jgi:hypothetical protein
METPATPTLPLRHLVQGKNPREYVRRLTAWDDAGVKVTRVYGFLRDGYYDDIHSPESGGWIMDHPIIKQFEAHAELLDISGSVEAIDEAIVQLATWMDGLELSEDDQALLCHIGAVLYREGLRGRIGMRP